MNDVGYFDFDLRRYLSLLNSNFIPIVLCTLAFLLLGIGLATFLPKEYESQAILVIDNEVEELRGAGGIGATYERLIVGESILHKSVLSLGLDLTTNSLRDRLEITSVKNTPLLLIAVADENPKLAASIVNEIVLNFSEEIYQDELLQLSQSKLKLQAELDLLTSEIQSIESDLSQMDLLENDVIDSVALTSLIELKIQRTAMLRHNERLSFLETLDAPRSVIIAQEAVASQANDSRLRALLFAIGLGTFGLILALLYFLFSDFFSEKIKDARSLIGLGHQMVIEIAPKFDDDSIDIQKKALEGIFSMNSVEGKDTMLPLMFLSSDNHSDVSAIVHAYGELCGMAENEVFVGTDWTESIDQKVVGYYVQDLIKLESNRALSLIGDIVVIAKAEVSTKESLRQITQRLQVHNKTIKMILLINAPNYRFENDMAYRITNLENGLQ